ncbi:aldo/keto reductase, partial [Bacillus pumilus]
MGSGDVYKRQIYGNEEGVGRGIQLGLTETGLRREDLFVTSKVWNADLGYESTLK